MSHTYWNLILDLFEIKAKFVGKCQKFFEAAFDHYFKSLRDRLESKEKKIKPNNHNGEDNLEKDSKQSNSSLSERFENERSKAIKEILKFLNQQFMLLFCHEETISKLASISWFEIKSEVHETTDEKTRPVIANFSQRFEELVRKVQEKKLEKQHQRDELDQDLKKLVEVLFDSRTVLNNKFRSITEHNCQNHLNKQNSSIN
ncbi:hypothetical protein SSS_08832 [Sarcoptes scabiei]|uniref:Uncharacterized protein n=1 Tax=Sarcoptes scabiei TaxID=52283 RepID=A0A834RII7_SARSC|nr:hypothetical protein SSS_08832 [Sarcoptes scabiei]UXI22654.1 Motile sperm domain-containing protein 2 [Sarcoptes scabiei]